MHDGSITFLQQAHRNNWQQYLASLQPNSDLGWDVCALTASDERQAGMYRRQLDLRREAGLLPSHTRFEVHADPDGRRIGSGGATLRVLTNLLSNPAGKMERALIIHSGGDSRRLPHCSATGKLFARVPRELPDGRASTVFDEFLISLSGLTDGLQPGVLIASGDVLLVFDHLQLSFRRAGVIGVSTAAPVEMGRRHGVYVPDSTAHTVRAYLHKPGADELASWQAIQDDSVQIDTGLVWLDAPTANDFAQLLTDDAVAALCEREPLNLYGDLLLPLAQSTTFDAYLTDTSDGPCTSGVQAARNVIWQRLRGTSFTFERLQPAVFIHFGSSVEYWRTASDDALRRICNWVPSAASWSRTQPAEVAQHLSLIGATVDGSIMPGNTPALVIDSQLAGSLEWQEGALISGLRFTGALRLGPNIVINQIPIEANGSNTSGWVTRLYGLRDNPKLHWADLAATFLNHTWHSWLADMGITPDGIWSKVPEHERSLWTACLFPLQIEREDCLSMALSLQSPATAPQGWRDAWLRAERLSLATSFQRADAGRLLADISATEDYIALRRFMTAVESGQPATSAMRWLGRDQVTLQRRSEQVNQWLLQRESLLQIRGYRALSVACGDIGYEDRAFSIMADMIGRSVIAGRDTAKGQNRSVNPAPNGAMPTSALNRTAPLASEPVRVECAARIDFGGGWTDTPPYSIERGGCVLNAAVTLQGQYPIIAEAAFLQEPKIVLESKDIDTTYEPKMVGDILAVADPADPFALLKAALIVRGVIPVNGDPKMPIRDLMNHLGTGLVIRTQSHIPRGSGLGSSSILAGAVLEALGRLLGEAGEMGSRGAEEYAAQHQAGLFSDVLWLEQLLTTGGGWQDQVGGLTGGIKLLTSQPGLPQNICIEPIIMSHQTQNELAERLVLVYTGQQRLAKNLLHAIMSRWMSRDTDIVWMLGEIARLALSMRDALSSGDLDGFGWLLNEHWSINKRMDPGCTNPFIDSLFKTMQAYVCGGKLAGAGGGGFAIVLAKDIQATHDLKHDLALHYRGTPVGVWECEIPFAAISPISISTTPVSAPARCSQPST